MSEKNSSRVPYPEVDAAAKKFATDYARDMAYDKQLRLSDKQAQVSVEALKDAEAAHAQKNWLSRKLGERSLNMLRSNVDTQVDAVDLRDGALNSIGIGLNIQDSREHVREHLDEYIANGVELAKADGVRIDVRQP